MADNEQRALALRIALERIKALAQQNSGTEYKQWYHLGDIAAAALTEDDKDLPNYTRDFINVHRATIRSWEAAQELRLETCISALIDIQRIGSMHELGFDEPGGHMRSIAGRALETIYHQAVLAQDLPSSAEKLKLLNEEVSLYGRYFEADLERETLRNQIANLRLNTTRRPYK